MYEFILIIHVLITAALITLILVQQGKGAEIGAAFGSGASNTVFGSSGSASFLSRATALLATLFFATSLSLSYIATQNARHQEGVDLPLVSNPAKSSVGQSESDIPVVDENPTPVKSEQ